MLEAFDKSRLILSGNSSSLARWHETLGLQPHPFVAGLSSLSVDGGQIVLMDIVIEKLYPIAFINSQKGAREGPWDENEERVRSDKWQATYEAESTALREKSRKRLEGVEDLVESLLSASQDISDPVSSTSPPYRSACQRLNRTATPPDNLEGEFDDLLCAADTSAKLRQLSADHLVHLASYAKGRMQQEMADGQAEIEAELQVCRADPSLMID